ncbi:MAG: CbiX/SirB N-terminal domain-containing protein [Haloglomus sp.]
MIRGTLILTGREGPDSDQTIETHADRLRDRNVADSVVVERYDELGGVDSLGDGAELDGEETYVMPVSIAQPNRPEPAAPSLATSVPNSATLCDPIGWSPVVTEIIADRAAEHIEPAADASLVLVGLGSSWLPHQRQVLEYHETRLTERTAYDEVTSSYLLQDPPVECARYNVSNERMIAVPVFLAPSAATREEIPNKLGLGRDGVAYAEPIGTHPRLTDAIHAEVMKQHVLEAECAGPESATIEGWLDGPKLAEATDSRGSST